MNERDVIFGVFALLATILIIVREVAASRTVASLTTALKEARNDPRLVDQLHTLAIDVVPVDLLHKALDIIGAASAFAQTIAPPEVDDAINAGADLAKAIANGKSQSAPPPDTGANSGGPVTPKLGTPIPQAQVNAPFEVPTGSAASQGQ